MEKRLSAIEIEAFLARHPGWDYRPADGGALHKTWRFADFHQTMAFVNAVAAIAHARDHHPDLQIGYDRCAVRWTTHDAGGVTARDAAAAAEVDALPEAAPPAPGAAARD